MIGRVSKGEREEEVGRDCKRRLTDTSNEFYLDTIVLDTFTILDSDDSLYRNKSRVNQLATLTRDDEVQTHLTSHCLSVVVNWTPFPV